MSEEQPQADRVVRPISPELDAILGVPLRVLDDGFIRVVDYMGSDASVVQAARVSYGAGTKAVSEDRGLIRYLMRHWHTTPFEMADIKLHVRIPMDAWRQWIRHRTASVNEYSTRYSVAIDSAQVTPPTEWREQAGTNRQGSEGMIDEEIGKHLTAQETKLQALSREIYENRIERGVAREQARKDLPLSTYTEAYWKTNLHNLLHFLRLRMDGHAQKEIRDYATVIGEEIVAKWVPATWEAFCDYRMQAVQLTRLDQTLINLLNKGQNSMAMREATGFGWLNRKDDGSLKPNRERTEFENKLLFLGMSPELLPWNNRL